MYEIQHTFDKTDKSMLDVFQTFPNGKHWKIKLEMGRSITTHL